LGGSHRGTTLRLDQIPETLFGILNLFVGQYSLEKQQNVLLFTQLNWVFSEGASPQGVISDKKFTKLHKCSQLTGVAFVSFEHF
jgi:hypothetical protein